MKTIEVVVGRAGDVRVETSGYVGPSCRDATRSLEARLGAVVESSDTPEAYLVDVEQQGQQQ